jgi:large subunit ribosomal protein L5
MAKQEPKSKQTEPAAKSGARAAKAPPARKKAEPEGKKEAGQKKGKPAPKAVSLPAHYVPRLLRRYREEIVPAMMKKHGYKSPMQAPRIEKVVVNIGVGEATGNIKALEDAQTELALITGQKPKLTRASRSVAQFKVRRGMPIGCCVTIRGWRMYDFLDRLINVAIPRVRDFRGLPENAFDGRGNHSLGIREQLIFTELDYDKISATRGMNVTTVTSARTDEECRDLLSMFGMPFRRKA